MNSPKRFAVFARVSTRDQLTGYSLEVQEQQARDYVKRAGGTVVKVYSDQESATGKAEDRAMLQSLLADATRGLFGAVVIQETTRLSRNLGVMVAITEKLTEAGIALHDFSGPVPLETPEGEFVAHMKALVGRFAARQGVAKSLSSRERVLQSGGIAAGRPPFGRRSNTESKKLELIPEKRDLMRRAYDLIVNRRHSLNRAAVELDMADSSLRKAIRQAAWTEAVQHFRGKSYTFPCPQLLTPEQLQRIEARLAANKVTRPHTKGEYLLQGLVRCAACAATLTGQTSTKNGKRYSVYRHPVHTHDKSRGCLWHVPVEELDPDVLTACANAVSNGKSLRQAIEAALAEQYATAGDIGSRLKQVEADSQRASVRLQRTLDSLVAFADESEARKRLTARASEEEQRLQHLRSERDELTRQAALIQVPPETADDIAAKLRSLYWGSGIGPERMLKFEQQREFVRTVVGRNTRDSALGIYVRMFRAKGASKKAVKWAYKLDGCLALAENYLGRDRDSAPDIKEVRAHTPQHAKVLAGLARATVGIKLPHRPYAVQLRTKGSSDA
jgi:DNA invertase Pin-like site-specific DNA recombinase